MTEREQAKSQVVLEIGVGAYPFPVNPTMIESRDRRQLSRKFNNGSMYIGIDCPPDPKRYFYNFLAGHKPMDPFTNEEKKLFADNLAQAQKKFATEKPDESISFLLADAYKLPLADESVDEVFLSNVFGSQLGEDSLEKILLSISRVIKPKGKVVIRETATPWWSWPKILSEFLKRNSFIVEEFVKYGETRYLELLDIYGATFEDVDFYQGIFKEDMYFCIARKE